MKKFIFITCLLFIVISISAPSQIQTTGTFNLYNTNLLKFSSNVVDDTFHIFISLPDSYGKTKINYPVLYALDGDVAYGMAASIARYLQIGGSIPELIIVGIGYGAIKENEGNMKRRDYTPTQKSNKPNTGGAEKFLEFLVKELIPYIDSSYRTDTSSRIINGYSLGGLFVFYALFNNPGTFDKYIIGSPYLIWDNYAIFDYEEKASLKLSETNATVFISVGSEESEEKYFNPIDEMVTILQGRDYKGLNIQTKVFDGSTHLLGPPEALTYGLVSLFENQ